MKERKKIDKDKENNKKKPFLSKEGHQNKVRKCCNEMLLLSTDPLLRLQKKRVKRGSKK
jgi:hypothetical protein